MKLTGAAKMIRVHFGDDDRWQGKPLHEAIVEAARREDLAGATVYRGIEGYGASSRIHRGTCLRQPTCQSWSASSTTIRRSKLSFRRFKAWFPKDSSQSLMSR